MADGSLSIKRSITVRAVVTPRWKEDAEREISNAIAGRDAQLGQLQCGGASSRATAYDADLGSHSQVTVDQFRKAPSLNCSRKRTSFSQ